MTELARYEAARHALAEANRVDEVKSIRNKAKAMQIYAEQAKDRALLEHATDIRMRAEIRAGKLLRDMNKNKGARGAGPGRGKKAVATRDRLLDPSPKLSDLGVTKTQSSRWQKLAALSPHEQEQRIETAKQRAEAAIDSNPRQKANGVRKPNDRYGLKRKGPISIADRCCMAIRPIVQDAVRASLPAEFAELFAALRDELNDLEKSAAKRRA